MRKTRFVVTLGLVMALGVAAIAYADGASDNEAGVVGKVKPTKLDKKKYKPVTLFTGVETSGTVTGAQQNPEQELISWGKNVKIDSKAAPTCSAPIEFLSTDAAKQACPKGSAVGKGKASIVLPGGLEYEGLTVTVFNGPAKNQVRLHTYDPRLAGATPTVFGKVVKSKDGSKYGQALTVPDAPDVAGDTGMITEFNASLDKKSGVATARCKSKKFLWKRTVTYDDGSKESVTLSQKCKRKGGKKK
ncbi:MAG: hypothetical protein GEU88_04545 [Solirubrobacterales bacterium]|nr:hypothetical protein [Solirubrobacterales bacterium]